MTLPELLTTLENARRHCWHGNKKIKPREYENLLRQCDAEFIALSANNILQLISVIRLQREALLFYAEEWNYRHMDLTASSHSKHLKAQECLSQCDKIIGESK